MFSSVVSRLRAEKNPLYLLRDQLESQGVRLTDLIGGNVHEQGIQFPQPVLEEILTRASRLCTVYRPDSFGRRSAREAISAYYQSHGLRVPPENMILTPGTSIAYWYCFKLLADESDEILCPSPTYPLFDYIAALSGVRLISYRLDERASWDIDVEHLESMISNNTRALVLISPHNPTGHVSSSREVAALAEVAARHDLAIISDEVFSEFLLAGGEYARAAASAAPLVITLNGFSKMFALPGIKLGWMALSGTPERVSRALQALELISDTFLPVNEIVQAAVEGVFSRGGPFIADYVREVRRRWELSRSLLPAGGRHSFVAPAGGFYATLKLEGPDEEKFVLKALREEHLLLHPGHFYDMKPHHLVMSFIQHPDVIRDAVPRLARVLAECD